MTVPVHQRIADPVLRWPPSGWWFTIIGALIGAALLLAPDSIRLSFPKRLLVCVALILTPAVVLVLGHICRRDRAFVRRARAYGALVTSLDEANVGLDRANSVINELVLERQERNSFRIAYCCVLEGKPMIALERKRGVRLKVGDSLTVIAPDLGALGTFEVIDDAGKQCRALSAGPMNALWLGNMKRAGAAHSEPPLLALAMRFSVEEDGDDRKNTENTT
jgi:hypothetical protein